MRILLISYFFPPYNTIAAIRSGKMAKYLLKFGHDVRVLTANEPTLDKPLPRGLELEIPEDRVLRTGWFDYNNLGKKWLRKTQGDQTLDRLTQKQAATGDSQGAVKEGILSLASFYRSAVSFPDGKIGWIPYALHGAKSEFGDWRPDIIFASTPPPTSLLVAAKLARRWEVPWVADFRDLWTDNAGYSHPAWRKGLERRLESKIMRSASGMVTVSDPLAETLASRFDLPVATITNGFDLDDYPSKKTEQPPVLGKEVLKIAYTGTLYEGGQNPAPLLQAIGRLQAEGLPIEIVFYTQSKSHAYIRQLSKDTRIELHDIVPLKECLKVQTEADVLVYFLWQDPTQLGIYSGKLFDYVGAGKQILGVGPNGDVAAELIRTRSLGVVLEDVSQIEERLRSWLELKRTGRLIGPPESALDGLSREDQARKLERFLTEIA